MPGTVTLHFLGRVYDLRADDPQDDVAEVVAYVERVMAETEKNHQGLNPQKIMVLASLHMARDYVREKKRNKKLASRMKVTSERMVGKIDSLLED